MTFGDLTSKKLSDYSNPESYPHSPQRDLQRISAECTLSSRSRWRKENLETTLFARNPQNDFFSKAPLQSLSSLFLLSLTHTSHLPPLPLDQFILRRLPRCFQKSSSLFQLLPAFLRLPSTLARLSFSSPTPLKAPMPSGTE